MTLRSNFLLNRIIFFLKCTSFHLVFYLGFIRCVGKCFTSQQVVLLWKILFFMKLFYFIFILFYFIYFILFHILFCSIVTQDVRSGYVCKVLDVMTFYIGRWNSQFILYCLYIVTGVVSQGCMLLPFD